MYCCRREPNKQRLTEKPDRDLRRDFIERFLNFFSCLGQSVRIDIDSDATTRTAHVFVRLKPPNGLYEVLPAIRTLKSDFVRADINHQGRLSF